MFNFITETILNDLSKVKYLLGAASAPASGVNWDPGIETGKSALFIERLNKFIIGGTTDAIKGSKIYKRAATTQVLAYSTVTIPTVVAGTTYRLGVQLAIRGYADGMFARDRVTYGKPFYVEYTATVTTASTMATALKDAWNANFKQYDNFPVATTSGADLIFTSVGNPYLIFDNFTFESYLETEGHLGTTTPIAVTVVVGAAGKPAFGDYENMRQNHRLPTLDNYRPFGLNQEELPLVGNTYDEYSFDYVTARGDMGQSVVGELVNSETRHILWVNTAAPDVVRHITGFVGDTGSYSFDEILEAVGLTIIEVATGNDITPSPVTEAGHTTTTTLAPTTTTTTL